MTSFSDLLMSARQTPGHLIVQIPDGWRQGRTAYGGLSSAAAYCAARETAPLELALRSAQLSFIGPVVDTLDVAATVLRQGKSSIFVSVEGRSAGALALTGVFLFMVPKASPLTIPAGTAPTAPSPDAAAPAMRGAGPAYWERMEYRHALAATPPSPGRLMRWARLRERNDLDPVAELLLVGDALPPAVTTHGRAPVVASSATWTVHLHGEPPVRLDGWWLVQSRAESALGGVSSQKMEMWGQDGIAALSGVQIVSFSI